MQRSGSMLMLNISASEGAQCPACLFMSRIYSRLRINRKKRVEIAVKLAILIGIFVLAGGAAS